MRQQNGRKIGHIYTFFVLGKSASKVRWEMKPLLQLSQNISGIFLPKIIKTGQCLTKLEVTADDRGIIIIIITII